MENGAKVRREMGLFTATSIVVANMVGAGDIHCFWYNIRVPARTRMGTGLLDLRRYDSDGGSTLLRRTRDQDAGRRRGVPLSQQAFSSVARVSSRAGQASS